ncbi:MAG: MFS transporter [Actinomycetota bacterium]|nr:MFS transporter [Actinomycetota bacterium]
MKGEGEYGLYGYRWVVLASFMLVAAVTQLMWLNYAPITSQTQELMGVSEFKVVLLATMFPLVYIPVSIPAGFIIDRRGFRAAVLIGAVLTTAFSFLRLFADNYVLVLLGMIGISVGQPFVLNSITKVVSSWFPTEESALANGLGSLSLFLGMIVAMALTPPLLKAFGEGHIASLRWVVFIYSLVSLAALVLFALLARPRPPKPPRRTESEALGEEVAIDLKALRALFGLHDFRLLCAVIFIGNGVFVGLMQLIEKILKPKGIETGTAGNIGAVMVLAGVVGCLVIPAISDRLMRRKPFLVLAAAAAAPTLFLRTPIPDRGPQEFGTYIRGGRAAGFLPPQRPARAPGPGGGDHRSGPDGNGNQRAPSAGECRRSGHHPGHGGDKGSYGWGGGVLLLGHGLRGSGLRGRPVHCPAHPGGREGDG